MDGFNGVETDFQLQNLNIGYKIHEDISVVFPKKVFNFSTQ